MNLVPQFSDNKKTQDERLMLQKKFGSHPKRIESYPEGIVLPHEDRNMIFKIEYGQVTSWRVER